MMIPFQRSSTKHRSADPLSLPVNRWLGIYLLAAASLAFLRAIANAHRREPWIIGDWLINYSAGFIRRGLPGALIAEVLRRHTGFYPWAATVLQIIVCAVFLVCLWKPIRDTRPGLFREAAILSPATTAFFLVYPANQFRKEILLYALLAWFVATERFRDRLQVGSILLGLCLVSLVLSHEALFVFFPYIIAATSIFLSGRTLLKFWILPAILAVTAVCAVIWHAGTVHDATVICRSLENTMPFPPQGPLWPSNSVCNGSIAFIGQSVTFSRMLVVKFAEATPHAFLRYGAYALLAMLPPILSLAAIGRVKAAKRDVTVFAACALCAWICSLGLFFIAVDWGRWISIHATCSMLLVLALSRKYSVHLAPRHPLPAPVSVLALVLYVGAWSVPTVAGGYSGGYLALPAHLVSRLHRR